MFNKDTSLKILMIEDDSFLRKLYRDQLTKAGFQFSEAVNGIEGLNKLRSEKPDLLLLDLILPRKNGFDVLSEMKRDPELKNIPVIILSNLGQESDIQEALSMGVKEYLVKSDIRFSEVVKKIKAALAKK